ncbi:MAG TPA: hypothetical protein VKY24_25060 [Reyranella sp.]|nr:hypothetical protein [Reyranella sp.]
MATPPAEPSHVQSTDTAPSLVVATGGSATAGGTTTTATGAVSITAHDSGHASTASGDASFQAAATGSAPTADATTFLDISGAHVIQIRESSGSTQGSTDASAGSTLHFHVVANGSADPNGPVVIVHQQPFHGTADASGGNVAQVSAVAETHGTDTAAATSSDATTVENQFSLVHATSLIAV